MSALPPDKDKPINRIGCDSLLSSSSANNILFTATEALSETLPFDLTTALSKNFLAVAFLLALFLAISLAAYLALAAD